MRTYRSPCVCRLPLERLPRCGSLREALSCGQNRCRMGRGAWLWNSPGVEYLDEICEKFLIEVTTKSPPEENMNSQDARAWFTGIGLGRKLSLAARVFIVAALLIASLC